MTRDDSLDPLIELYERFRRDCPDGGADEARAWAAEQDALVEEPALREAFLESVRGLLEGSGSLGGLLPGAISAGDTESHTSLMISNKQVPGTDRRVARGRPER